MSVFDGFVAYIFLHFIFLHSALSLDDLKHLANESAECNMIAIKL